MAYHYAYKQGRDLAALRVRLQAPAASEANLESLRSDVSQLAKRLEILEQHQRRSLDVVMRILAAVSPGQV
jgi:hypothetical protein